MSQPFSEVAPAFVDIAHRIVWCTVATVDGDGRPWTRVLHPIWEWDGAALTGWIATSPSSPKARHLEVRPELSLTYWDATHDTASATCRASWGSTADEEMLWERFSSTPMPLGYDPRIIPGWDSPAAETFGALRLNPYRLRAMPGTLLTKGVGQLLSWQAA